MKTILLQTVAIAALGLLAPPPASGGTFTISNASTTAQTLGSGAGQTGTITETGVAHRQRRYDRGDDFRQ